jgi:hypothetical protein
MITIFALFLCVHPAGMEEYCHTTSPPMIFDTLKECRSWVDQAAPANQRAWRECLSKRVETWRAP